MVVDAGFATAAEGVDVGGFSGRWGLGDHIIVGAVRSLCGMDRRHAAKGGHIGGCMSGTSVREQVGSVGSVVAVGVDVVT